MKNLLLAGITSLSFMSVAHADSDLNHWVKFSQNAATVAYADDWHTGKAVLANKDGTVSVRILMDVKGAHHSFIDSYSLNCKAKTEKLTDATDFDENMAGSAPVISADVDHEFQPIDFTNDFQRDMFKLACRK